MRLRRKPWAKDMLKDHPEYVIPEPERYKRKME